MINIQKNLATALGFIGLKVASIATGACFLIIVEEPVMPIHLIEK